MKSDHGRGKIQHNAYAAIVTSKLFKAKSELPKKGKGSRYSRKAKHKNSRLDQSYREFFIMCMVYLRGLLLNTNSNVVVSACNNAV